MKRIVFLIMVFLSFSAIAEAQPLRRSKEPFQFPPAPLCINADIMGNWHVVTPIVFCKNDDGVVYMRGRFHSSFLSGLTDLVYVLPPDFCPLQDMKFYAGDYAGQVLRITIFSSGEVFVDQSGAGIDWWYAFDGITYLSVN